MPIPTDLLARLERQADSLNSHGTSSTIAVGHGLVAIAYALIIAASEISAAIRDAACTKR